MGFLSRWLAHRRAPQFGETLPEEFGHDTSGIADAYRDLLAHELQRWGIPERAAALDIRHVGHSATGGAFVAILRLVEWDRDASLRLMLGLPFLEKRLRDALQSHWLAEVSGFTGVWLHASEKMLAAPGIGELRELLAGLTGARVQVQDNAAATMQRGPEGKR